MRRRSSGKTSEVCTILSTILSTILYYICAFQVHVRIIIAIFISMRMPKDGGRGLEELAVDNRCALVLGPRTNN